MSRLTVNPEPLKVIDVRPGGPPPEPQFVVCHLRRGEVLLRASVHKDYCQRAPEDGKLLKNKATWRTTACDRDRMHELVGEMEEAGIEVAVWCSTCRGWSTT